MHDFAFKNLVVDDFAVQFDFAVVEHFHGDFLCGIDFGVVFLDVFARQESGKFHRDTALFHFVDYNDGEQSVVNFRVGAYRHTAAYAGAVADPNHKHAFIHSLAVDGEAEFVPLYVNESVYEGRVIFQFAAESLHCGVAEQYVDPRPRR